MKKMLFMAALILASAAASGAETNRTARLAASRIRIKCAACAGKGYLKVRPPDRGQYAGRIEDRSHWDVKLDPCPICGKGHGWRVVWDLSQPDPSPEPPCMKCGWSGLDPSPCRQCLGSGMAKCTHRDCKDGWIITEIGRQGRRASSRRMQSVEPCPECKGLGKVVCPKCQGLRAELCRKCHGAGRKNP